MAEKADKKPDAAAAHSGGDKKDHAKGGGGLMSKTPVLLGGVMLLEAVVLFAGFKFLGAGSPKHADAADVAPEHGGDGAGNGEAGDHGGKGKGSAGASDKKMVEIPVVDFRAINKKNGQTFLFDVSIFLVTKGENEEKVKKAVKDREALIKDRIATIIRQSEPEKLGGGSEPGLETLRRQVKYQLDEIVGEGMVEEVLVPRCIPFRAEY